MSPQLSDRHTRTCRDRPVKKESIRRFLQEQLGVGRSDIDSSAEKRFKILVEQMDGNMVIENLFTECSPSTVSIDRANRIFNEFVLLHDPKSKIPHEKNILVFFALVIISSERKDTTALVLITWHLHRQFTKERIETVRKREESGKHADSTYKELADHVLTTLTSVYIWLTGLPADGKNDMQYYALAFVFLFLKGKPLDVINDVWSEYRKLDRTTTCPNTKARPMP